MTGALAERFDRVLALDVSPAMLERARAHVTAANVTFLAVPGDRLEGVEDRSADAVVCYLVLQHLPSGEVVCAYLREFARVLAPQGEAYIQVPVLQGAAGRLRRALRTPLLRLARRPEHGAAFRGFRLTRRELDRALADAGLRVLAEDEGPSAYSRSRDRFLRLARAQ
jgi:ubiquinone/menaquinone biosynthesis C-methylase UbiE